MLLSSDELEGKFWSVDYRCQFPREAAIDTRNRKRGIDWLISELRKSDFSYGYVSVQKRLARYLLRNGSLLSIEVEPKLVDVLAFRSFSGEYIYATLSESAEHLLLKAWDAS